MSNQYRIAVVSQKGGVGKTTISINIAAVLKSLNYDVLLIDTDITSPSLTNFFNISGTEVGYKELLESQKPDIQNSLVTYALSGFYILPAGKEIQPYYVPDIDKLNNFYRSLSKLSFDFVIVDTPPASFIENALYNFSEALIISTPDSASIIGAKVLSDIFEKRHLDHRLIVNRVEETKHELSKEEIERAYGDFVYAVLPEDKLVKESEQKHTPVYILDKFSPFSAAVQDLCKVYTLKAGAPSGIAPDNKAGFISKLKKAFS
ncbi:MAG: ParA family protein [Candidatus Micrarchaeia archaeon]